MNKPDYDTSLGLYQSEEQSAREAVRQEKRLLADMAATFDSAPGRRVFWWLLLRLHFLNPVSRNNASIYQVAAERDFGLELNGLLAKADPALLADILTMGLKESQREREENQS